MCCFSRTPLDISQELPFVVSHEPPLAQEPPPSKPNRTRKSNKLPRPTSFKYAISDLLWQKAMVKELETLYWTHT